MNIPSLILGAGGSLAILRMLYTLPAHKRLRGLASGLIALAGAVIGARGAFVLTHLTYYSNHSLEILRLDQGGLFWPGAPAGALLFAWVALTLLRFPLTEGLDRIGCMLLPLSVAAWFSAWQSGLAYGRLLPEDSAWAMLIRDEFGRQLPRLPLQLLAALSLALLVLILERLLRPLKRKGVRFFVLGTGLAIHCLLFSFMRYDNMQMMFSWRLDSWAALGWTLFFGLGTLIVLLRKPEKQQAKESLTEHTNET